MRNRFGRTTISLKLIVTISAAGVLIVSVFAALILKGQREALIAQVKLHADQISETIKRSTRHHMLLNQRKSIHRLMDTLGKQEGMEKIRIFNKEGEIIFSSDKAEIGTVVDKQAEACFACHAVDEPIKKLDISERSRIFKTGRPYRTLGIINPIHNEKSCWEARCHEHEPDQEILGVLDVTMPLDRVEAQLARSRLELALLAVTVVVIISLIVWILTLKWVGRPVRELVEATRRVAEGDLTFQTDVRSRDELGALARSFNLMTQHLSQAQQQVYQSEKLASLGRLAAGIAHEINNPLTGVLSFSSMLQKSVRDPEGKKDLDVIVRETKRCREIVKGLLDFSRQVPFQKTHVSLEHVVRRALKIVEHQIALKDVAVTLEMEEGLPDLWADSNQLQQVFINLLVNAIDAVDPHVGAITLRARPVGAGGAESVEVVLSDNGIGISKDHLPKIFEPFYSTKGTRGTGLGLSVVWGIIERHGGNIRAESEEGQGATFVIHLPLRNSESGVRRGG